MTNSEDPRAEPLLAIRQVAEMLNCSTRHVRRLTDRNAMPRPMRLGNLVRWRRDEIVEWIAAGCPQCTRGGRL